MVQFRMKALNQMQKPDDLDLLMKVTKPRGWVGVGVVGAALAALVLWGFTGNIPSKVSGEGVVTPAIGISDIQSMVSGFVTDVHIATGDTVAVGDPVATVETDSGKVTITAPFQGVIGLVFFNAGRVIGVGSDLYLLERTDVGDGELIVYVFVAAEDVSSIAPGRRRCMRLGERRGERDPRLSAIRRACLGRHRHHVRQRHVRRLRRRRPCLRRGRRQQCQDSFQRFQPDRHDYGRLGLYVRDR